MMKKKIKLIIIITINKKNLKYSLKMNNNSTPKLIKTKFKIFVALKIRTKSSKIKFSLKNYNKNLVTNSWSNNRNSKHSICRTFSYKWMNVIFNNFSHNTINTRLKVLTNLELSLEIFNLKILKHWAKSSKNRKKLSRRCLKNKKAI